MERRQRKTQAIGDSNDPRLKEAKKVVELLAKNGIRMGGI
ncbi:hypothetical protein COLO4_16371 [Corchorus olitorius]|uniref:Uncharacterized protein n=1 Tax=Corchorus olitorius TaxID=93759 RepID=A0A1R3JHR3_9ROSI|nr:hypothetical protein COLO4_16371 [Corchorus olitorius]